VDERFYDSGFYRLSIGLLVESSIITDAARLSFALAFGIVPDLQVELERYYDNLDLTTLGPVQDQECTRILVE
jgi:hypothetical protein